MSPISDNGKVLKLPGAPNGFGMRGSGGFNDTIGRKDEN